MIYKQNRQWIPWLELAAVLSLLTALQWIYRWQLTDWSPNPLLFLVLYFAVRYGTRLGFAAAAGSVLLHAWIYYQRHQDLFLFFDQWAQYKWLAAYTAIALFTGHYVSDRLFRYQVLVHEYEDMHARLKTIEQSYGELAAVKESLEKRIIGAQDSMLTLYKMAKALDSDNSEVIFTDAVRLVKDILRAGSIVIYRLDSTGSVLRLKVSYGQEQRYPASVFPDRSSVYARVLENKSIQLRSEGEADPAPLLAGPILGESGEVLGIIGLHDIEFKSLSKQTVDLFRLILQWMGESCVKAFRHEKQLQQERCFPGTRILKPDHFYARLQEETLRASDFLQHFVLLKLPIDLSGQEEHKALQEVDQLLAHTLREDDVFSYDAFRGELLFLLPATSPELERLLEERIKSRFPEGA